MKTKLFGLFYLIQGVFVWAQQSTCITGKILDAETTKPLSNVVATLQNTNLYRTTDLSGFFVFENIEDGSQILQINNPNYQPQQFNIIT